MSKRRLRRASVERSAAYIGMALVLVFVLFPIYWMAITSVKIPRDIFSDVPVFLPRNVTSAHYQGVYRYQLFPALWNSVEAAVISTLASVALGTLAAYGFVRYQFRGKRDLLFWILSTRMLPPVIVVIPLFVMLSWFNLLDKVHGLMIVYTGMNLPFAVWLMSTFIGAVPLEIEEAAQLDGCTRLRTLFHITLPLVAPGLVATATFCFIFAWNEFLFALILTRRVASTLPIALGSLHATFGPEWGRIGALALIVAFPIWVVALLSQKHMVQGLTMGGVR